jgi:glutamine amidotransferase
MIAVVDYGAGNVQSVVNALERIDAPAVLTNDPAAIRRAAGVIVPGVGAAQDTMRNLERAGLVEPLLEIIGHDVPYLGICMGMQALMSYSEEHDGQHCLDVIPGRVQRLETMLPVPHMGWNEVVPTEAGEAHPILRGLPPTPHFYFVHSFVCVPDDPCWVLAHTTYGAPFASLLGRGNLIATQFHPEKSGPFGLRLLGNFVEIVAEGGVANMPAPELAGSRS